MDKVQKLIDSKFEKLKKDEPVTRERKFQGRLRELLSKGEINKDTFDKVCPCGSKAGVLYGLPKILKSGVPIRPIISAVGTYNCKLAKYHDSIIKPFQSNKDCMLKDPFDFVNRVSKVDLLDGDLIFSFDVESLFTNIPVRETVDIIIKRAYPDNIKSFNGL